MSDLNISISEFVRSRGAIRIYLYEIKRSSRRINKPLPEEATPRYAYGKYTRAFPNGSFHETVRPTIFILRKPAGRR